MTKKKKVTQNDDALLLSLERTMKAMNLKSEPELNVISEIEAKPKSKAKKPAKKTIFTPLESPEPELKARQDVASAFIGYFGAVSKLENWQRLCLDLDVADQDLSSLKKCKMALSKVNVNICDVVEAQLAREEAQFKAKFEGGGVKIKHGDGVVFHGLNVKKFATPSQLLRYTKRHKKFYPRQAAKELGPIRCLLKHMN